jgi:hypothetical protein
MSRQRQVLLLTLGLKVLLVALLAFGAFSGAQQFEGKAFGWRLLTYPLATLVVPAGWWLLQRPRPYPAAVDNLLVAPFLIDVLGNAFDLYDQVWWWDDANHFVNWALLSGALAALLIRLRGGRWTAIALVVGFGATTAVLWELAEYVAFIRNSSELDTAYEDTLGDLALGLAGAMLAAMVAGRALRTPSGHTERPAGRQS